MIDFEILEKSQTEDFSLVVHDFVLISGLGTMITSWIHHDILVRLVSQLALCHRTFWVRLRHHPVTPTLNRGTGTMHYQEPSG